MTDEMTTSDNVENEVNDLLQKKDFGVELKKAREKAGLSIIDVAENLLINADIIKAIENSQAEVLPPLIFTQGYIRSYARLLNISADEIINDYVKMVPDEKQALLPHSVLPVQKSSNDAFMKIISFGFIVCGIIVLAFWLYKTDFNVGMNLNNSVPAFNAQDVDVDQVEVINDGLHENYESEIIKVADENVNVKETSVIEEPISSRPVASEAQIEQVQPEKKSVIEAGKDQLILSALGESWCEVEDSTGKRLFYQLLNRGQEIAVSGTAPFTVFLGNAPKVRVEINNKIVNFESLINKSSNIASIEISQDAAVLSLANR